MKILHVISSLNPAGGGPPAVAARLAAAQAWLGHEVTLFSYRVSSADQPATDKALASVPYLNLCRIETSERPGRLEDLSGRQARRTLRERSLLDGCGFVHLHGVWEPILRRTAIEAERRSVPYAVRPAGMLDPWSLRQSQWKKKLALRLGYRWMLNRADFIHTLNADEARLIEPLGLKPPRVVIPNGVFLDEIDPLPPAGSFRSSLPIGDRPYVLFLSRLHYKKGLPYLADAFSALAARLPGVHLVVAGPDGGDREPFAKRVAQAGLTDRVHLVGPLYGRDKYAAMVDAACFCLPSHQEGFSVAIVESLACGLPVVISEGCHFPEVAEVGAGEVVPLDRAKLAEAMERILSDAPRRSRMSRAGRALVESRFTWPRIAERTIEAYGRSAPS